MPCNCNRRNKRTIEPRETDPVLLAAAPSTPDDYLVGGKNLAHEYQATLDAWLSSPFRHMGQTQSGTDCIGLVLGVYKQLGLVPESMNPTEYARQWYLTDNQERHPAFEQLKASIRLERIDDVAMLRAGDILCYRFGRGIESHVGLLSKRGTIIHSVAGEQADKVIESRFDDNRWRKRYVYAYRLSNSTSTTAGTSEHGR